MSIVSSLLGFIFALCLFYITQNEKKKLEKHSLANLLKRELEYNIDLIDEWKKYINQDLYFTKWKKPIYVFTADYDSFQNNFIDKAFKAGVIYELLDNNQIKFLLKVLSYYSKERKVIIIKRINRLKEEDIVDYDDEGVPTTSHDYIQMILEDELTRNKDMQSKLKELIPLIKYEENALSNVFIKLIGFVQTYFKRYRL